MHGDRRFADRALRFGSLSLKLLLGLAGGTLAADPRRAGGDARRRCAQDFIRDAVCLVLQRIVDGADLEFRVDTGKRSGAAQRRLITDLYEPRFLSGRRPDG
jgi:hypothetical protein